MSKNQKKNYLSNEEAFAPNIKYLSILSFYFIDTDALHQNNLFCCKTLSLWSVFQVFCILNIMIKSFRSEKDLGLPLAPTAWVDPQSPSPHPLSSRFNLSSNPCRVRATSSRIDWTFTAAASLNFTPVIFQSSTWNIFYLSQSNPVKLNKFVTFIEEGSTGSGLNLSRLLSDIRLAGQAGAEVGASNNSNHSRLSETLSRLIRNPDISREVIICPAYNLTTLNPRPSSCMTISLAMISSSSLLVPPRLFKITATFSPALRSILVAESIKKH